MDQERDSLLLRAANIVAQRVRQLSLPDAKVEIAAMLERHLQVRAIVNAAFDHARMASRVRVVDPWLKTPGTNRPFAAARVERIAHRSEIVARLAQAVAADVAHRAVTHRESTTEMLTAFRLRAEYCRGTRVASLSAHSYRIALWLAAKGLAPPAIGYAVGIDAIEIVLEAATRSAGPLSSMPRGLLLYMLAGEGTKVNAPQLVAIYALALLGCCDREIRDVVLAVKRAVDPTAGLDRAQVSKAAKHGRTGQIHRVRA